MRRVVRFTLMWLLAFAVPLQGLSAATMVACGLGPHDHAQAHVASHSHRDEMAGLQGHIHVAHASLHRHADVDHSHAGKTGPDKGVTHKCSVCASCCASAVVSSETVSFDSVKLTDFFAPLVARTLAAYVTEGLERPPRSFLA